MQHSIMALAVLAALGFGQSRAAEISVESEVGAGGDVLTIISVVGDITAPDLTKFNNIVRKVPDGTVAVYLNSEGGDLEAGIAIGREIFSRGLSTAATDVCASACALAWIAGRKKFASDEARIGFHVAYVGTDVRKESGLGNALVGLYLGELGLGQNVVRYVTSAPPEGMQWLSFRDAELLGIPVVSLGPSTEENHQATAPAEPPLPAIPGIDQANVGRATRNAITRYREVGISGLESSSVACWRVVGEKPTLDRVQYCRVLDLFGMVMNQVGIEQFGPGAEKVYFRSDGRLDALVNGLLSAGVSDPSVAKQLNEIWNRHFEIELKAGTE
ncbi:ATP-dependent Clp protease proteolytic subunit [Mesorhizobium sp. YM1C-6-2]|uniref:ATP-dependent Clp protease proteolytic subunit n=1 Tax=Mesorhizobium sp. YM1C-6-2 TaxID=1827501 RepID=UPI0015FFC9E9|nr:ATP-dependent Clp protease proteolytic subunit [Mesorhizobium sp. YM1C-6-2]